MFNIKSIKPINKEGNSYQQIIFEFKERRELQMQDQTLIALYFEIFLVLNGQKDNSLIQQKMQTALKSNNGLIERISAYLLQVLDMGYQDFKQNAKAIFDRINNDITKIQINQNECLTTQVLREQGYLFTSSQYDKIYDKVYILEIQEPTPTPSSTVEFNDNKVKNQISQRCSNCEYFQEVFIKIGGNDKRYCNLCFEEAFKNYI
ncbi:hypothetical protein TTHERM_00038920 (macronuclear) [Tetrahymena thermophila SB210]|uniref:Uncharacterized protein n=1 Tax=Tetrahymena thermophila (strain SB210) TaxID=312017 RepID=Q22M27_TETTS|nr:hypothetical protein TTHERM_00038920 [Tetrahymena thermophila SB210]EAR86584.1 hypothetical protein TTHERM_00038920 [Tetrahymena thermophila SB210]|eukprot:XP_977193.1 hypothetical protein TTHERM_00038920 [Tetrahymena thermophila SB210]